MLYKKKIDGEAINNVIIMCFNFSSFNFNSKVNFGNDISLKNKFVKTNKISKKVKNMFRLLR
jgi:di/tripeptidase